MKLIKPKTNSFLFGQILIFNFPSSNGVWNPPVIEVLGEM